MEERRAREEKERRAREERERRAREEEERRAKEEEEERRAKEEEERRAKEEERTMKVTYGSIGAGEGCCAALTKQMEKMGKKLKKKN